MCGIYGKYRFKGQISVSDSLDALNMMEHRGPDGYGFEYGNYSKKTHAVHHNVVPSTFENLAPNYFLGHRRLSIVDLNDNAFQPMISLCERYSIVFNGEIYNHIELKEELLSIGCRFKTDHSDTEVLLNTYIAWGADGLSRLRGMFAFAIFDREENRIFIARDRIGQKTLYYELTDSEFTFASELPPIVKFGEQRSISPTALNLYMSLGYIPYPHSIFEHVQKLPPATYAIVDLIGKTIELTEYWDIDSIVDNSMNTETAVSMTRAALEESVKYRLRADVSVGAFISGGIDSTLVVKSISASSNKKFDIYGADFPDTDRSEKQYIVEAADKYRQHLKLSVIDLTHIANIEAIVRIFDEPFDGASSIALFDLFKTASKDHKIILTGDGGDEMFAGYTRYLRYPKRDSLISILRKLRLPGILLSLGDKTGLLPEKLKSLKSLIDGTTISNFTGISKSSFLRNLLKKPYQIKDIHKAGVFSKISDKIHQKRLSDLKTLQYLELKTILPGRMLYKLDRISMFYGVEARSPFLDHKLAELAYTIPDNVNISNGVTKAVLKHILSEDFDDKFVHREKQGFGNPLSNWFRNAKAQDIFATLLNRNSFIFHYLDFEATHNTFHQFKNGFDGSGEKQLWRILVLAHYFENYKNYIAVTK